MLANINPLRNDIDNTFLQNTLHSDYCTLFIKAFKLMDSQGYLDKNFYDTLVIVNGEEKETRQVRKFTKFFSPFWKTEISIKDVSRTVLYLHDELLKDKFIDKMVYTFKPHLMQYYQMHWFEDFCAEIIKSIVVPEFKIVNIFTGRVFNFFQNGNENDTREIDIILGVECDNIYKIVAIECKKTLTPKEITTTNNKIKNKILKSHSNIIDGYIHIGCFNNGVIFDKFISGTQEKYKQGQIQIENDSKVNDVPYFALSISSVDNLKLKICHAINEILAQW